jgi:hypothetical protein
VIVRGQTQAIPAEFCVGDYEGDEAFRGRFQAWLAAMWAAKDQQIEQLLAASSPDARTLA